MRTSTHIALWEKTGDPNSTMSSVPNTPPTLPPNAPPWRPSSPTQMRRAKWCRRRRIRPADRMVPIVLSSLHFWRTSSPMRRASMVIVIVIINLFSRFNNADPLHIMLVDCCMLYCREWSPIVAVWWRRPPWSISSIAFYPIFTSYFIQAPLFFLLNILL